MSDVPLTVGGGSEWVPSGQGRTTLRRSLFVYFTFLVLLTVLIVLKQGYQRSDNVVLAHNILFKIEVVALVLFIYFSSKFWNGPREIYGVPVYTASLLFLLASLVASAYIVILLFVLG